MRRTVIVLPGALTRPTQDSAFRQNLPNLQRLVAESELFRLAPLPSVTTPEALYLGMRPDEAQMAAGPLLLSALRQDPPERSTQFCLTWSAVIDGELKSPDVGPRAGEMAELRVQLPRLNTKLLTGILGVGCENGLVWEGRGEVITTPVRSALGQRLASVLPQGDYETALRGYIDSSINLLMECEFNQRRIDEGEDPLNVLWPWGGGPRLPVPNLVLRRGEVITVESTRLRMSGLARLAGYRVTDPLELRAGLQTNFAGIARRALAGTPTLVLLDAFREFSDERFAEERGWIARELDQRLIGPLLDDPSESGDAITIVAPMGLELGVGLQYRSDDRRRNIAPFDERILDDSRIRETGTEDLIDGGLRLH